MIDLGLGWSNALGMMLPPTQPVLAQVNLGSNPATFLGIILVFGGLGLYFLRNFRPQLARDYDIAFSAIALLCGAILFFQGWRLDPLLTFGYYMLAISTGFFAYQSIRLREVTTEQAKRFTPIVDDERPVSRVYRAELDEIPPVDERPITRRIRGTRDTRSAQDEYEEVRRRPSSGRSLSDRSTSSDRVRRKRPSDTGSRSSSRRSPDAYTSDPYETRNVWDDDYKNSASSSGRSGRYGDYDPADYSSRSGYDASDSSRSDYDASPYPSPTDYDASDYGSSEYGGSEYSSSSTYNSSSAYRSSESVSRPKRPRRRSSSESTSADYADYQPIDYGDRDPDNSADYT
jgi:hypothetical protein